MRAGRVSVRLRAEDLPTGERGMPADMQAPKGQALARAQDTRLHLRRHLATPSPAAAQHHREERVCFHSV